MKRARWIIRPALYLTLFTVMLLAGCIGPFRREPTPEPVVLRYAHSGDSEDLERAIQEFQADHPYIEVELVDLRASGANLASMVRNGDVDVFRSTREALEYAREDELLLPLGELLTDEWIEIADDYYGGVWDAFSVDGQSYGVPAGLDLYVSYIHTGALDAMGIQPPPPDWTLFEYLDLANRLNQPDGVPGEPSLKTVGCCTTFFDIDPVIFIYLYGGSMVDDLENPTVPTLDDPQTIEAVKWYADLFNRYDVAPHPDTLQRTFGSIQGAVANGYCGTWFGWYSDHGGSTSMPWNMSWQMMPLPKNESTFELGDAEGYFVSQSCEHPREALMLLRFFADRLELVGDHLPPRKSLVNSEAYQRQVGPNVVAVANAFSERVIMIPYEESMVLLRVGTVLVESIADIVQQDLDAGEVLREAQQRSLRILD
jgi:multiple sugar transport system substrate-binding protein